MPSVSYTHIGWDLGGWRFGEGGVAGRGVSVLRVSGSKIWMGSLLDEAGY